MTDNLEIPTTDEEQIEVTLYETLRHVALVLFAAGCASIFAAVVVYTVVK